MTENERGWSGRNWRFGLFFVATATFLFRSYVFGYPLIDVDEQFYLLAGDRMLHASAIPYVDIWDRKPPGLFLLYAGTRLLGGEGIVQYQVVAALFVTATAVLIALLARRIAPPIPSLLAALAYAPTLASVGGGGAGGQTPVFYNLFVAGAALILVNLASPPAGVSLGATTIRRRGQWAMLLIGLALQLKPTAVFEGIFFGIVLLCLAWRADPRWAARTGDALLWVLAALLPTLIAIGAYAAIGHLPELVYANIGSVFARNDEASGSGSHLKELAHILGRTAPLIVPVLFGEWLLRPFAPWRTNASRSTAHLFLIGWLGAAVFGFLIFGTYFDHYALPLVPPLAVLAAGCFAIRRRRAGPVLAALCLAVLVVRLPFDIRKLERRHGDTAFARALAAQIAPRLHGGCLFVFYGNPILYHLTHSCLPSRWAFPFHLSLASENKAIGIDAAAETRRILAGKPPVIVDRVPDADEINPRTQAIVRDALARDYRRVPVVSSSGLVPAQNDRVWERLPGH